MRIVLIVKPGHPDSGVGRYAMELEAALLRLGHTVQVVHPVVSLPRGLLNLVKRWMGWDIYAFLENYPIWIRYPKDADIYHFSSQNLASVLFFHRPRGKVVITVHDIIPWLVRNDPELCLFSNGLHRFIDWLANKQLFKCNFILTVSGFTEKCIIEEFGLIQDKIKTVHEGIN